MAAHRMPSKLKEIIPINIGVGAVKKASIVFVENELEPIQRRLMGKNN